MAQIRLLDAAPELGAGLDAERAEEARRNLVVEALRLPEGPWLPDRSAPQPGGLGLLILEGLILRRLNVAGATSVELLGGGDLMRPWQEDAASFASADWEVMEAVRIAILDRPFIVRAGDWPEVIDALVDRAMQRSRSLAVHAAIENMTGLEKRLLVLFWHLAERWGRIEPGGIEIRLRLPHRLLAELVGARRPSVTMALGALQRDGALERRGDGWVLRGEPPSADETDLVAKRSEPELSEGAASSPSHPEARGDDRR